jgi:hypothetical protein
MNRTRIGRVHTRYPNPISGKCIPPVWILSSKHPKVIINIICDGNIVGLLRMWEFVRCDETHQFLLSALFFSSVSLLFPVSRFTVCILPAF